MYYNQIQQKTQGRDKLDDPNKWYIEIYNIPLHFNKEDIVYFIWKTLEKCRGLKKVTNPIVRSEYLEELRCVRIFFRSKEQVINCLDLNGILYGEKAFYMKSPIRARENPLIGAPDLRIKRFRQRVQQSFNKLCIQNISTTPEHEVLNILRHYGQIKAFEPVYQNNILVQCFFQYDTSQATEECLAKLHNQKINMKAVSVKRAAMGKESNSRTITTKVRPKSSLFEKEPHSFYLTLDTEGYFRNIKISCVLLLRNIIQMQSDKSFIRQDILKQLQKIGKITRDAVKDKNMYVEYEKVEYAQIAYLLMQTRKYDGRAFDVSFYDPVNFADDILV